MLIIVTPIIEIEKTKDGLFLGQQEYARDLIQKYGMMGCNTFSTPMEPNLKLCSREGKDLEEETMYCQIVGSLIYLTLTRADIAFAVRIVSRFMQKPKKPHWKQ